MALPQDDPSLPSNPSPIFSDTDAVRGDHQRANNQYIWENLEYLDAKDLDDIADGVTYGKTTLTQIGQFTDAFTGENINDVAAAAVADADKFGFWQAAGSALKSITWSNIKATLKTYFDTLYRPITYNQYAKLSDTQAAGTSGGTLNSGSWVTRVLNTEDNDSDGIVSISSNQFTLQAGTYRISASAPAYAVGRHQAKLRNTSDGVDTLIGTSEFANQTYTMATHSFVRGVFTIASAKNFEIQHQVSVTRTTDGGGLAANFGVSEVYTIVEIWKLS